MVEKEKGTGNTYELNIQDFIKSFIGVVKTVFFKPSDFYQNMPRTGGYAPPLIFLVVCLGVSGILSALFSWKIGNFFTLFIFYIIFSFIAAGVLHFIAQQFFEGKGEYEGIYRVVAYASVVQLLNWLPWVHGIFFVVTFCVGIYGLYLQVVGVEKVHQITTAQAIVTVLIALAVFIIISVVVSLVVSVPFMGFRL